MKKFILEEIKKFRISKGYSQKYMAARLNIAQNNYGKIELGVTKLTIDRFEEIADILNFSINLILKENGIPERRRVEFNKFKVSTND